MIKCRIKALCESYEDVLKVTLDGHDYAFPNATIYGSLGGNGPDDEVPIASF